MRPGPGRRGDPVWLPEVLRAFGVTVVEDPGWKLWGAGDFGTIWGVMAHHTGANNTSPQFIRYNPMLRDSQGRPQLSSQIHLSRTGVATLVGAGIAWHAGRGSYPGIARDAANQVTIGIEAQSDGVSPWPDVELDAYYRICAAICWYLGIPASRVISHHEWSAEGKWDPGAGNGRSGVPMPMGPFRARVQHYIDNPPFTTTGGITVSEADRIIEFIKGYVGPIGSDTKDNRQQLTGGRDKGEYPGYPQIDDRTLVDALAAVGEKLGIPGFFDPHGGSLREQNEKES